MASKPPDAFLSYTRFDDQHDGGAISKFCRRLASAVQAVTGIPFGIFQDVGGIGIGEHWPGKLDEMLNEARFFIPIVTPSYFTSKACREELEKFLRAEAERQRNDLVLPIYYIECELLEDDDLRAGDPLANTLHKRQRQDWRELRFESFDAPNVRRALERLARDIVKARRPMPASPLEHPVEATPAWTATPVGDLWERWRAEKRARADEEARSHGAKKLRQGEDNGFGTASLAATQAPREAKKQETGAGRPSDHEGGTPSSGPLSPGTVFRDVDTPWCPELVVIPPGEFLMGSPDNHPEASDSEKPRHLVRIGYRLAVGRFPVTFEEYDYFVAATHGTLPDDTRWGRSRRPVINVSWDEAKAYVEWLAAETRRPYRLLSEAEWEYACRAGTTTCFSWGDDITPENANYSDAKIGKTTEVGSYAANPWGLCDMAGNVWEWVEDRWHDSYAGAPDDGSAWLTGSDSRRVLRGGSWDKYAGYLRSADRSRGSSDSRYLNSGFRVARVLGVQSAASSGKDAHRNRLEYHNPDLTGRVTFNYSNNNGQYSIGRDELFFETKWSKASDQSIHLYNDPPSIVGVAEAPGVRSYRDVNDSASYDMSSRVRTIQEGEHAILKNRHCKYAVLRILDIKDRTRSDTVDELTFDFWILTDSI